MWDRASVGRVIRYHGRRVCYPEKLEPRAVS